MLRRLVEFEQYTSFRLATHLAKEEIAASIGTVGDALDNALMESIIGLYKQCRGVNAPSSTSN